MQTIKGADFIVRYDEANHILYGIYGAIITPKTTAELYAAKIQLITQVGVDSIHGVVMDFRRAERFEKGNMEAVQRESHHINQKFDLSRVPVALVVDTPLQEQIVDFTAKVAPDRYRKQLVYTIAEAYGYFDEWHQAGLAST